MTDAIKRGKIICKAIKFRTYLKLTFNFLERIESLILNQSISFSYLQRIQNILHIFKRVYSSRAYICSYESIHI